MRWHASFHPMRAFTFRRSLAAGSLCLLALLLTSPRPSHAEDPWARLDDVAEHGVAAGNTPGVVFLVGHEGKIVYRKAFGARSLLPTRSPMTVDTVFDLASLTKVIATNSAVMALLEEGRIRPQDRVTAYWPEFGQNGKDRVTVRQLLTHTSGLPSWVNYSGKFADPKGPAVQDHRQQVLDDIAALPLANPPGTKFVYSDLGFITLGNLVQRITGEPLDLYVKHRIFEPLKMRDTTFNPGPELCKRCAPTTPWNGIFRQGQVHDGNSAMCGGVAGQAGLFSTANDLAKFAWMLLSSDEPDRHHFPLSPATVRLMTSPQSPRGLPVRGFGWDIDTAYSHVRGDLMPLGTFGHTGFTGTYIWVDPYSRSFVIGLSNRVHPDEKGDPLGMWAKAANVVEGIVRPNVLPERLPLTPPVATSSP